MQDLNNISTFISLLERCKENLVFIKKQNINNYCKTIVYKQNHILIHIIAF